MSKRYHILVGKPEVKTADYELIFGDYEKAVVTQEKEDTDTDQYKQMRVITLEEDNEAAIMAKLAELNNKGN